MTASGGRGSDGVRERVGDGVGVINGDGVGGAVGDGVGDGVGDCVGYGDGDGAGGWSRCRLVSVRVLLDAVNASMSKQNKRLI